MDVMMEAVQVPAPLGEAEHHQLRKPSADCDTAIDLFGNGFGIARCLMKNVWLGQCVANNYYAYHDLLAGHRFCEEAAGAGMFPGTRLSS
jgi:hypothetical protein